MIELSMNTLQANTIVEVNSLKAQMSTAPNIAGDGQREDRSKLKPITEYKAVSELANLGKDKTMYRDFNIKLKDSYYKCLKNFIDTNRENFLLEGSNAQIICDAALKSAKTGKEIKLNF